MTDTSIDRIDLYAQANTWQYNLAFGGSLEGKREKYNVICGLFTYVWRKNGWEAHIFYNGYKRDDMPDDIMRVDLDLPVEIFQDASVKDILEYVENTVVKNGELSDDSATD